MIFLTIGTTEPFDRLVIAMDNIANHFPNIEIIAQISSTNYIIRNMKQIGFLSPNEYYKIFDKASLIISHAGMGTIISALLKSKPIIVMPRRASFQEANSDHQYATASRLEHLNYINVAENEDQLLTLIKIHYENENSQMYNIGTYASNNLLESLKAYINQ